MAAIGNFDATNVPPAEAFEVLPAGKYKAMIVESELKDTAKGDGQVIKLVWQITEGDHQGRKIFQSINVDNPNEKAVAIGKRELSAVCHAAGKLRISDTAELHDIPCLIQLKVKPAEGTYEAKNEVKGIEAIGGATKAAAQTAAATTTTPAKTTATAKTPAATGEKKKMPWH